MRTSPPTIHAPCASPSWFTARRSVPVSPPYRAQIAAERTLRRQSAKKGLEIDQGFFIAHVLADAKAGNHLIQAMLLPKREAEGRIGEFRQTGFADLGGATVERKAASAKSALLTEVHQR